MPTPVTSPVKKQKSTDLLQPLPSDWYFEGSIHPLSSSTHCWVVFVVWFSMLHLFGDHCLQGELLPWGCLVWRELCFVGFLSGKITHPHKCQDPGFASRISLRSKINNIVNCVCQWFYVWLFQEPYTQKNNREHTKKRICGQIGLFFFLPSDT